MNKYCICTMPETWDVYKNNFKDDRFEFIVDVTKRPFDGGFQFTEQSIRDRLSFEGGVSKKSWWNPYGNRTVAWYYAHFRMLLYYMENPDADYYYFLDDDVKADWGLLFAGLDRSDADFMAYFIFKNIGVVSQDVPVIDNQTYSGREWFKRYPPDGDTFISEELFGSFFPIVRFSNKAMRELVDACHKGFFGYGEGFVPSYLNWTGYKLKSIINKDDKSDLFDVEKVNILHKNQKITWSWI